MKMTVEAPRIMTKWQNIVKVYAAESAVKQNEKTYVKGMIPNGKATKTHWAVG